MITKDEILFPHSKVREIQENMVDDIVSCLNNKKNLIMHAPTGIGKTAAVLSPALSFVLKKDLTVFFLTSRHTQHALAIDTLKKIKKKHNLNFVTADIIGKKWMCSQLGVDALYSSEFADYCKRLKEENSCEFYNNTKKKSGSLNTLTKSVLEELKILSPSHVEEIFDVCNKKKLCAYEMAALLSKEAKVIISDYNYVFDESIRNSFFLRAGKELEKSIIIVDEAHNLPKRIRELRTVKLSSFVLERAIKEAKKMGFGETEEKLKHVLDVLDELGSELDEKKTERLVKKEDFVKKIEEKYEYDDLVNEFVFVGDEIKEKQKRSFISSLGLFFEIWPGGDVGYVRTVEKVPGKNDYVTSLYYKCLDPSLVTKEIIDGSYCTILMSGTLTPTFMYKDILGFKDAVEREFKSPFPKDNRLSLIIPETTTKFTRRGKEEYEKIANVLLKLNKLIPGNVLVFFPSYSLRNNIFVFLDGKSEKKILLEKRNLSKEEKHILLEEFKGYNKEGALLLAVTAGNFGEGIDLPGDYVKGVIVVGLPLERPSLEIKGLIDYYDKKFKKGWEYGYVFPAIIKVLQNAGRCIRSETDKGVIAFLDERFAWENYYKCFPMDMDVRITKMYEKRVKDFFNT